MYIVNRLILVAILRKIVMHHLSIILKSWLFTLYDSYFFKCKSNVPLYLSGVEKNMRDLERCRDERVVRETKHLADVKSRSNTVHLRGKE